MLCWVGTASSCCAGWFCRRRLSCYINFLRVNCARPSHWARLHILTYPIIVLWTAGLAKACDENRRPSLWLLPLMVLWANLHGGFTIGLMLAFGFGLDATIAAVGAQRRRVAM